MHVVALIPHPKTALSSLLIADAASAVEPGSTITARHVCVDPAKIGGSVEEVDMQEMRIRDEGTASQRRNEVRKIFEEWSAGREPSPAGAKVEWVEADGEKKTCPQSSRIGRSGDHRPPAIDGRRRRPACGALRSS